MTKPKTHKIHPENAELTACSKAISAGTPRTHDDALVTCTNCTRALATRRSANATAKTVPPIANDILQ